jgi:peptidyl-prolyl cis-trans isomerase C
VTDEPEAGEEAAPVPVRVRRRPVGRGAVILVAVAALAGVSAAAIAARDNDPCPPAAAALSVRGKVVSTDELQRRLEVLRALYGVQPPQDEPRAAVFRGDAAKAVAVALLVEQDVKRRHLEAADKSVRDALDRFIAERYPQAGREGFVQALGNEGVSEADVLAEFRRLLETRRLFEAISAGVKLTDDEVAAAFEKSQDQLAVPERRKLRHLVVATEEEAKAALARVRKGESFAAVASAVSLDASTKAQGGALGLLSATELDPAFAKEAFAAAVGQPFGPVKTNLGWHVGVVEEIVPGRPVTLDEVRNSLRDQLLGARRLEAWRAYLGNEIKAAKICYSQRFRPSDPTAPPPDLNPAVPAAPGPPPG